MLATVYTIHDLLTRFGCCHSRLQHTRLTRVMVQPPAGYAALMEDEEKPQNVAPVGTALASAAHAFLSMNKTIFCLHTLMDLSCYMIGAWMSVDLTATGPTLLWRTIGSWTVIAIGLLDFILSIVRTHRLGEYFDHTNTLVEWLEYVVAATLLFSMSCTTSTFLKACAAHTGNAILIPMLLAIASATLALYDVDTKWRPLGIMSHVAGVLTFGMGFERPYVYSRLSCARQAPRAFVRLWSVLQGPEVIASLMYTLLNFILQPSTSFIIGAMIFFPATELYRVYCQLKFGYRRVVLPENNRSINVPRAIAACNTGFFLNAFQTWFVIALVYELMIKTSFTLLNFTSAWDIILLGVIAACGIKGATNIWSCYAQMFSAARRVHQSRLPAQSQDLSEIQQTMDKTIASGVRKESVWDAFLAPRFSFINGD